MSVVSLATVRDALSSAGLLVGERGALPASISAITDDSRRVAAGCLFVAVKGVDLDGHDFLSAATKAGAVAAIVEQESKSNGLPLIVVRDGRRAAAVAAAAFHGYPSRALSLIGVTGTNGKTTSVGMLRHLLDAPHGRSASIGTLGVLVGSEGAPLDDGGNLTTPGPIELQRVLRLLVDSGVSSVAVEVSSHALQQRRVEGLEFAAVLFTNLTRDHLDYHGTMDAYFDAKASLLQFLAPMGTAVRNADDPAWGQLGGAPRWVSFGVQSPAADVVAREVQYTPRGSAWRLTAQGESHTVRLPLIGDFNVANAVGAAATAHAVGLPFDEIARRLSAMPQVPGRLEILAEHPTVLRDYAHTPDALGRALAAVRKFTPGALVVVFGAGGDRDRGKRPLMAAIADRSADRIIVTSDNPRTEDPERIIDEIVKPLAAGRYERIEDRRAAIARALAVADPARDVVLLAGKGHETYQVRGTEKLPFDEKEIVLALLHRSARQAEAVS